MKTLIIEAVEQTIAAKRELIGSLSTKQIKSIYDAFILDIPIENNDRLQQIENENGIWESQQYFMRKYAI